jgi:hypothetical protein
MDSVLSEALFDAQIRGFVQGLTTGLVFSALIYIFNRATRYRS